MTKQKNLATKTMSPSSCYVHPHGPATKDSISPWMRSILWDTGIYNFVQHSFHEASSSAMLKWGIPVEEILRTAGWSNATTFCEFYNRPEGENSVLKKSSRTELSNSILRYFEKEN